MLLDPNTWSTDGSVSLGVWSVSYDGKKVAYTVKANNSDEATLYVMDVATGKKSEIDVIEGAKYASPSWTPSSDAFYYTWLPRRRHASPPRIAPATPRCACTSSAPIPGKDRIVHEKTGDPKTFVSAGVGKDGRWLIATIEHGWTSTDVYFQDLRSPKPEWRPLVAGVDARYDVERRRRPLLRLDQRGRARSTASSGSTRRTRRATSGRRSSPSGRTRRSRPSPSSAIACRSGT